MNEVGEADVWLEIGGKELRVKCLVMPRLVNGFNIIIGMDVIGRIGGVAVNGSGVWQLGGKTVVAAATAKVTVREMPDPVEISNEDFEARFDGEKWTVGWKWKGTVPTLTNTISKYNMSAEVERRFDEELEK